MEIFISDNTLNMSKKEDVEPVETNKIMKEYLDLTKQYTKIYGEKTIVLLQVGAFFELYGLRDDKGTILESQIEDICIICQLNYADKKLMYNSKQVIMAGFREYMLDKNIPKIIEAGYTAVVYVQEKDGKNIKRVLHSVCSQSTYLSCETDSSPVMTNNIMCIWLDTFKPMDRNVSTVSKTRDTIVYGVSTINIFTGKSSMFEYQTPFILNPTTFDELERYVSVFSPSEILFISSLEKEINRTILQYIGVKCPSIHIYDSRDMENKTIIACSKQVYVQHMLSTFFGEEAMNVCREFQMNTMATQAFCYLLNYIQEHDKNIVRKISIPEFNNTSDRLLLANHTLKQLNIIDDSSIDGKKTGNLSSVLSLLNKCCSPIGKRNFKMMLLNPSTNETWLQQEYDMIEYMLQSENIYFIDMFRKQLSQIRDIEKICRQLLVLKVYPSSIYQLYKTIGVIHNLHICLAENKKITDYLCKDISKEQINSYHYINDLCLQINEFLENHFVLDDCKNIQSLTSFENNIIKKGISQPLDDLIKHHYEKIAIFEFVKKQLNEFMYSNGQNRDIEFIKTHETEKSGLFLQITKTRANILKNYIKAKLEKDADYSFHNKELQFSFYLKDIKFGVASSANEEIHIPILQKICKELITIKDEIDVVIRETYLEILKKIEDKWLPSLEQLANYVANVDILQCKTYIAKNYKYCKPEIVKSEKSFVSAQELRHCLIEHIQQNEIYVANDICLGNEKSGMLLYGTNAVGKTSFIRALGISIIMAQSGMYVPCSRFQFKPYTAIFSRILGNDNIFKGLSTFAVEMSELRIILKMADKRSLILGDELCSGTETESALSIFVAGLMDLHDKDASFIFATHFHEIINYDEINMMNKLSLNHMSVIYDREKDALVYDRKLKDGPGTKTYGLEVCKSLYLTDEFLDKAYAIRNKYFPETRGELNFKSSTYNVNKIRSICEVCKNEIAEETHHLEEQHTADTDGFIGHFHKNHKANLVSICKNCHDKIHHDNSGKNTLNGKQRKKTTKGYDFM